MSKHPLRLAAFGLAAALAALTLTSPLGADDISPWTGSMKKGAAYRTTIIYKDGDSWWPEGLHIPHHHATRVEWQNIEGFPQIAAQARAGVRMTWTFRVLSMEVRKVANRNQWRTLYLCRISKAEPIAEAEK